MVVYKGIKYVGLTNLCQAREKDMINTRRLHLEKAYNVRDLGGYPLCGNTVTKWGVFYRSADLAEINKNDMDLLYDYGIKTIINLKALDETRNPIENDKRFNHIQVPLIDNFPKMFEIIKDYEGSFYLTMIKAFAPCIKEIFNTIAKHVDSGGILFHCLSGKDRTGIIAMLLLLLAKASDLDIIADYIVSAVYMRPDATKRNQGFETILKYPEEIEFIMAVVNDEYDGAENYLQRIGVSLDAINKIKESFITM